MEKKAGTRKIDTKLDRLGNGAFWSGVLICRLDEHGGFGVTWVGRFGVAPCRFAAQHPREGLSLVYTSYWVLPQSNQNIKM
jgi:hypothetical protein